MNIYWFTFPRPFKWQIGTRFLRTILFTPKERMNVSRLTAELYRKNADVPRCQTVQGRGFYSRWDQFGKGTFTELVLIWVFLAGSWG